MNVRSTKAVVTVVLMVAIVFTAVLNLSGQTLKRMDRRVDLPAIPDRPLNSVTSEEARRAALAWLQSCPSFVSGEYAPAPGMLEIKDQEQKQTVAYVLELEPRGFIIVTPDSELKPIKAFSESALFDPAETPENILLHLLRLDISQRIDALDRGVLGSHEKAEARALWEDCLAKVDAQGRVLAKRGPEEILWDVEHGPFLSSEWGQDTDGDDNATFNYYTPPGPDGTSSNYVCGCVATAFGQICNYYEWPDSGTGSYSYTWDNGTDPAQVLAADFGGTTYDWLNILDIYHNGGKTATQRQAAGELLYHCGIAVDMNYDHTSRGGSGADASRVARALENHFRGSGVWVEEAAANFWDRLYNNMVAHRAGELAIQDTGPPTTGGHAVVVDGVRHDTLGTKFYHLNMGWSGSHDTWYDIANPFATSIYTWDVVIGCVLDIVPTPDLDDPGTTTANPDFAVTWSVSDNLDATKYELQQAIPEAPLSNFADDAEGGTGDWIVKGLWRQSDYDAHGGTFSFQGNIAGTGDDFRPFSSLQLDRALKIDPSTTMEYWWGSLYFEFYEARLEISPDEKDWTTLKIHTENNTGAIVWHQEAVTVGDLAAYVGEVVSIRFVVELPGYSYFEHELIGFYLDDFAIHNGYIDDWTTVDNNITTESKAITATQSGDHCYRVRAYASDWYDWSDVEVISVNLDAGTDVVFIMDITSSTGALMPDWKNAIPSIAQNWKNQDPCARFALTSHADYPFSPYGDPGPPPEWAYRVETTFDPDITNLEAALGALPELWGNDGPESQYEAIYQVLTGAGRDLVDPVNYTDPGEIFPQSLGQLFPLVIYHFTHPEVFHDRDVEPAYPFSGSKPVASRTDVLNELLAAGDSTMFIGLTYVTGPAPKRTPAAEMQQDDRSAHRRESIAAVQNGGPLAEMAAITGGAVFDVGSDLSGLGDAIDCSIMLYGGPAGDGDNDGVSNSEDNCPCYYNDDQANADGDIEGDVCDDCTDIDGDGYGNPGFAANECPEDNCPNVANGGQINSDGDSHGDACDNCPNMTNEDQTDSDGDGYGAACECDDANPKNFPGNTEVCDGLDNDCDGLVDHSDPDFTGSPEFHVDAEPEVNRVGWYRSIIGSATYDVTVTSLDCFDGTVQLSVTGFPVGYRRHYFNPSGVVLLPPRSSATVKLVVEVTSRTPVGDYVLTVSGGDGTTILSDDVIMEVRRPRGVKIVGEAPSDYVLSQNYPNPFNPQTNIEFGLPEEGRVRLAVYNLLGQEVEVLVDSDLEAGYYSVSWDASGVTTGVYFFRIVASNYTETRRMVFM
ncbi:MAG: C10 family peptidase, partial [Gemmatimonadota bacterium]